MSEQLQPADLVRIIRSQLGWRGHVEMFDSVAETATFTLYDAIVAVAAIERPHGNVGIGVLLEGGVVLRRLFGVEPRTSPDEESIRTTVDDVLRYARARLPETYIQQYESAYRNTHEQSERPGSDPR